jgi:hypothetical protein
MTFAQDTLKEQSKQPPTPLPAPPPTCKVASWRKDPGHPCHPLQQLCFLGERGRRCVKRHVKLAAGMKVALRSDGRLFRRPRTPTWAPSGALKKAAGSPSPNHLHRAKPRPLRRDNIIRRWRLRVVAISVDVTATSHQVANSMSQTASARERQGFLAR